jgi:cation:H+ antiporter
MTIILFVQWSAVMAVALYALIKGADLFIDGAKNIGLKIGLSSFAVGVLIVGMGTSLPELTSSLAAVWAGVPDIVISNAVGSNITNILLIVGVMAFFGGRVIIHQNLLKTELPIFAIATLHFAASLMDGVIDRIEAVLLLATFGAYMWYIIYESKHDLDGDGIADNSAPQVMSEATNAPTLTRSIIISILGLIALVVGAKYTVDMAVNIATGFSIPVAFVSITAIAIGTSLPELMVTIQAIRNKQTEMGIGNIFGSNAFNMLVVVGVPAAIVPQIADPIVMELGLGIMLVASIIFFISGLARQIMRWEGLMMLIFFVFFMVKLVELIV